MKYFIKQLLREEIQTMDKKTIIDKFIQFVVDNLSLEIPFKVILTKDKKDITTTAVYYPDDNIIKVYIKNRALVDVLRSISHELTHHKQNQLGELENNPNAGDDGSPIENEANAKAGELIRIFGKQNPEIYNL
jgi:Zn-dependent peptidase ImmA (M78 family)